MSDEIEALAKRCEAATGPDRKIDCAIYALLNPHMKAVRGKLGSFFDPKKTTELVAKDYIISGGATGFAKSYTASLDAAMTLVPDEYDWVISHTNGGLTIFASVGGIGGDHDRFAATPALALTAACLRARLDLTDSLRAQSVQMHGEGEG